MSSVTVTYSLGTIHVCNNPLIFMILQCQCPWRFTIHIVTEMREVPWCAEGSSYCLGTSTLLVCMFMVMGCG